MAGYITNMAGFDLRQAQVEQNANLALRLCHYAYVLENGRIALSGPGGELAGSDYVQRAYLGV